MTRIVSKIIKGITFPKYGNPFTRYNESQTLWKEMLQIPGVEEKYDAYKRYAAGWYMTFIGACILTYIVFTVGTFIVGKLFYS